MREPEGRTVYGYTLGVLMLETAFPRPLGDVGNARTWPFPVRYEVVPGAVTSRVVGTPDEDLLEAFVDAGRRLVEEGVRLVTTSCGFLAAFQERLAVALPVPVLTSALLQVPLVARQVGDRAVVVLTSREGTITADHAAGAGWDPRSSSVVVRSLPADGLFARIYSRTDDTEPLPAFDAAGLEAELVTAAVRAVAEVPGIGAVVMECTNFVPYSQAVRRATGLPVYDLYTLVTTAVAATCGPTQPNWAIP